MGYEVDFLPVGEGEKSGDAITLRFGNLHGRREEQTVIIIDGGYTETGKKLVEHIKTYYQTDHIDLVVSTHPDADHSAGLEIVLEDLKVGCLWMHLPWEHTDDIAKMFKDGRVTDSSVEEVLRRSLDNARSLERLARSKEIPIIEPFTGVQNENKKITVVGPTQPFYESLLPNYRCTPVPQEEKSYLEKLAAGAKEVIQKMAEKWDLETLDDSGETSAENNTSTIILIEADTDKYMFFTSDSGIPALNKAADILEAANFDLSKVFFTQVPHHGSKRNVGPSILNRIIGQKQKNEEKLRSAFVSVAKNGEPKHPSKKVVNAFRRRGAYVYVTKGSKICLPSKDAPDRNWSNIEPLPFYNEVED